MTDGRVGAAQRQVLVALRYAVNDEADCYLAIMRLFTRGMSGFLADQSADEVTARLAGLGLELDRDTVDQRLVYLVEHGNLARSPRETEARSVREYLTNRARYQITPRGELVQRQIEQLLEHTDGAREVSSEMLPAILAGIDQLAELARVGLADAAPRDVAASIATLFAQFEVLVTSTRQFYSYLTQVLTRFDLGRDEFVIFKGALVEYLQRFVDEIQRHMPQVADRLRELEPSIDALCERANADERLLTLDGAAARRATGLAPEDWESLRTWFVGSSGRRADADNVRRLATEAMRSLLTNLRRLAAGADREHSRYADMVRLAGWFAAADDARAHQLWSAAFGLSSARHLSFAADPDGDPPPAPTSWWHGPVAEVPVGLRVHGDRKSGGRAGAKVDFSAAKRARLAERAEQAGRHHAAVQELTARSGRWEHVRLSDEARTAFLTVYSQALASHGRPLADGEKAGGELRSGLVSVSLVVRPEPGAEIQVRSPGGVLTLRGVSVEVRAGEESAGGTEERVMRA